MNKAERSEAAKRECETPQQEIERVRESAGRTICELRNQIDVYREALQSIAGNSCCRSCREAALVAENALSSFAPKQGVTAGETASCMICGHLKPFVISEVTQRYGVCADCTGAAERGRAVPALQNWADRLEAAVDPNHVRAGFATVIREMREWSAGLGSAGSHTMQPMADHRP